MGPWCIKGGWGWGWGKSDCAPSVSGFVVLALLFVYGACCSRLSPVYVTGCGIAGIED